VLFSATTNSTVDESASLLPPSASTDGATTDRKGLVLSIAIMLLSIPALVGS